MTIPLSVDRPSPVADDFDDFVRATSLSLLKTAVLLCGDRDRAEDLLQSTYTTAFRRWRLVVEAGNPVAYVRQMLTRQFLSEQRRRRPSVVPLLEHVDPAEASSTDPSLRLTLLEVLATLPALDRAVVVSRYWHDQPVAEVADALSLTPTAVRVRSSRALARLRAHFPDLEES